ncbi:VOC family protein [Reyranella soli]|uniref:VOC family protein n=1 Tax=Reyranella soli TaxID=1230389 RepID=A0A512NH42_9HYPH|nr:VOC family protein [Reyranella soli]GEP58251.1 VOC family protein [Reyranella soli]
MTVQQTATVQPYLFFDGKCEEALDFYKGAIGAKVDMMMRFKEAPDQSQMQPNTGEKVMHAAFHVGTTQVLASDGHCAGKPSFQGFGLALNAKNDAEAEKLFAAVGNGGQVLQPLTKTFFASKFGMVADKFGIMWMVIAEAS